MTGSTARPARLPDDIVSRALAVGVGLASTSATALAAFPNVHDGLVGGIGGGLGVFIGQTYRDRPFWRLRPQRRLLVARVQRTGVPSGDAEVDGIALDRLSYAAKNVRSDRIVVPLVLAALVTITVFAVTRSGPLWIVVALPALYLMGRETTRRWRSDPRPSLARLRIALGQRA